MYGIRSLFAAAALVLCTRGIGAQAVSQNASGGMEDTLPEHVALRVYDAFRRHDLDAMFANFDSVYTYEIFGSAKGSQRLRRDDALRHTKADTSVMRIVNGMRVTIVRSDPYGAFVNQEWVESFADGRDFKHFELFEVRHGKVVREIEGDRLINSTP